MKRRTWRLRLARAWFDGASANDLCWSVWLDTRTTERAIRQVVEGLLMGVLVKCWKCGLILALTEAKVEQPGRLACPVCGYPFFVATAANIDRRNDAPEMDPIRAPQAR